jgi:hypothetical protein
LTVRHLCLLGGLLAHALTAPASAAPLDCRLLNDAVSASRLAYRTFETGAKIKPPLLELFRGQGKFGGFATLSQGRDGWCHLAFKGSDLTNPDDLLIDLAAMLTANCKDGAGKSIGSCALGFFAQYGSIRDHGKLFQRLGKRRSRGECQSGVVVTGHSLGGALASLFAADAVSRYPKVYSKKTMKVVTFGEPRVFATKAADGLHGAVTKLRVINRGDLLASVPPAKSGLKHFGHVLHLDAAGLGTKDGKLSVIEAEQDFAPVHQGVFSVIYHALLAYEARLFLCTP